MSQADERIDAQLSRLAAATQGVAPRPGFSQRVLQRIGQEPVNPWLTLRLPARRFFPIGVVAAALAMVWAVSVSNQVNEAIATSDDTELSW